MNYHSIADEFHPTDTTITVADSKLGWAKALKELVGMLYIGQIPRWNLDLRLDQLVRLSRRLVVVLVVQNHLSLYLTLLSHIFQNAAGRKLSSLEAHDIVCKIAEVVVVGGVRRSALISLSNLSDDRMRHAKGWSMVE